MRRPPPPCECAQCGDPIPPRALACPGCGADERTGWRETSPHDGLDLPDHAWDDEDAPRPRSVGARRPGSLPPYAVVLAVLLVVALLLGAVGLWP